MHSFRSSVFFFSFLAVTACNNISEKFLPTFEVNIPVIKLRIPPLPLVLDKEIPVGALKIPINLDSTIRANTAGTFGANAVHTVRVKHIVLKAANADRRNNFSNFESARIRIYSDTSEVDIAQFKFPSTYSDSLLIATAASPDISTYLKGRTLSYNLVWKNRKRTTKPLQLEIVIALNVQ